MPYLCSKFRQMKIKCNFCNAVVDEQLKNCPQCGAPLSGANRASSKQPKTIEELQAWYVDHHLPPEQITRFFIGKDISEPKAFGIYKNEVGDCVVYKNKSTGERAIRYQGSDEAYAVNELYQRLKAEIADQKGRKTGRPQNSSNNAKQSSKKGEKGCGAVVAIIVLFLALFGLFGGDSIPKGYYNYQGKQYYRQNYTWYYYDNATDDWYKSPTDPDIDKNNASEFKVDTHYGKSFESTSWYDSGSHHDDDDDWDNDSGWDDDDDWDSGGTDWDSDW